MVVEITSNGVTPVGTCTLPTSIDINGLGSVVAGSTTTYTYTINGGSNYTFGSWSIVGGTLGAATGNQVTVTWGQDTGVNEASISYAVFCGADTRIGLKLVDITAIPVTPVNIVTCKLIEFRNPGASTSASFEYNNCGGTPSDVITLLPQETHLACIIQGEYNVISGDITFDDLGNCE
jgi:hypothetical protein